MQRQLHRVHTKIPDRIFYWIHRSVFDQAPLELGDAIGQGIPEKLVANDLRGQIAEEDALNSLPSAFLLVLLYTCAMVSTSCVSNIWALQHAVSFDIMENANFGFSENFGHKSLHDVNSFVDFSSWMELGFTPLFLSKQKPVPENSMLPPQTLAPDDFDRYLLHTHKVGPVKLAQMPWKPSSCREPGLAHKYGLSCAAQNSHHFLETTAHQLLQNTFQEDPNRTVWLANLGPDGHFTPRNLSNFSASAWLMPDTLRARLTFMVYSPDVDILLLTNVEFIFPRTGHIWKDITHRALPLRIFATWSSLTFEVLFYALIASLLFTELWEIYSVVRKVRKNRSGWQSFFNSYFNVWNGVDWSCIVLAYVMLGFQIHKAVLTRELRESLEGYPGVVQSCYQESQPELCADRAGEELLQRAEAVGILARNCRLLRGIYPAIVILRTLKAFSAQPRLAILTRTLSAAAVDLFHFSLVFFCVFAAFAVMGTAFFGEDEVHFATLDRAASVLFFALMGEVQWTSIDSLGRPVKLLFVGAFQFVGLLLMLNMLIAIMMDIYACTKSCATRSEPLWTSLKEVTVRNWEVFMGREISLRRLLKTYERQKGPGIYQSEEVIQVQDFMKWLPDLKWSQAERIIVHALVNYKREKDEPVGLEELLQAITDIQADVVALSERLPDPEQPSDAKTGCRMESAHSLACRLQRRLNRGMTLEDPCRDGLMEALQRGASVFSGHLESLGMPNQERQLDSPLPLPTLLASSGRENRWLHEGSNQAGSSAGDLKISSGDVQV